MKLFELSPDEWGVVVAVRETRPGIRGRLYDIGVTEGSRIGCVMRSPLGDPTAYSIRGAIFALRDEDAGSIDIIRV